ncbi:Asp23/Gls24 family envelope stress response protein [Actinomycetospora lutea]|uniref:Asp23/Gls24 family envelope stress response protein n=1 Tax=Actinomycetospora lutea TaxID=663604 RepID=UPI0023653902|nr:Asp23/Gls24 family envelope stress response protein [Actinomycetospora lutea]MDD7939125.1 Asp23/Gls24 family envelope stress response protein [Actinomycetospora lutea]
MTPATTPATGDPGTLTIADGVLEKLVAVAAGEVDGVTVPGAGGLAGVGGTRRATARVRRTPDRLDVGLALAIAYPAPVAAAADATRRHVSARVAELAGLTVGRVDVDVTGLPHGDAGGDAGRRTGRVVA